MQAGVKPGVEQVEDPLLAQMVSRIQCHGGERRAAGSIDREAGGRLLTAGESRLIDAFSFLDLLHKALAGELSHSCRRRLSGRRHGRIESSRAEPHDLGAIEGVGRLWSQDARQGQREKKDQGRKLRSTALVRGAE
ncbi:MAG: hypothetical protein WBM08_01100 [Prochlorococcaceae cyanobacterium]